MTYKFMKRALDIAKKGRGQVSPNPLVGAVIVKNNSIIAEGYHEYYGGRHAELNALKNCNENLEDAVMYVTLEPCSHYGKTPPCAEAIVKSGIKQVVVAMKDPNPLVSGKGISILEENGIEVVSGVLEAEAKKLNEFFIKYISENRPFVIIKTAMTLDGKIATVSGDSKWITNKLSRAYVHNLRNQVSAILVGIGTVLNDDPFLTTRLPDGSGTDPHRIIVDSTAQIPLSANVLNIDSKAKTIIATTERADSSKLSSLEAKGAEIIITPNKTGKVDLTYLLDKLGEMKIDSLLIEGGGQLNFSAFSTNNVDKVLNFIAPKIIGGKNAITPVTGQGIEYINDAISLTEIDVRRFDDDILISGYVKKGR
ncbi:bifunctional diaminohydroxyphosphoribosylaminopyrimidine deaminase/5-amino-6-(5-phosphoribosylamino)uracil reductase RibD [Proteinivorax hydrogeniformans]|uniref:Riboflavin biosynthesis protein RibD n=1 Tax=Proteinivorax hydrogeniformans TaxID=1826727 RepID=A0AAU8HV92_9FIRM